MRPARSSRPVYSPGVMRWRTGSPAPIAPIAPMETRPGHGEEEEQRAHCDSAKAKTGSSTPDDQFGPPRQPPAWISPTRMVRLKSIRVLKKASKVARVLARIRPEGNTTASRSAR